MSQNFLIIMMQSVSNIPDNLIDTFGIFLKMGLLDVNILIRDEKTQMWSLHFYKPFQRDCFSIEIHEIERFSSSNYTNLLDVPRNNLFPPKLFKFHNCSLKIATFSLEPFVIIRNATNCVKYDGVDVIIVNQISKTLNLIPIFMESLDNKHRGIIFKNRTATGAIKMVKSY